MVTAGKIFRLTSPLSLTGIEKKLRNYRKKEAYEEGDYKTDLITEITNLTVEGEGLTGIYSSDFVDHVFHRGKVVPVPKTIEAAFSLASHEGQRYLVILEKKQKANRIANHFSNLLFGAVGSIVEVTIPPENLMSFHSENPENTKITFFDHVDVPNVEKMSLYGPDIIGTSLFDEYRRHGDLWYIVIKSKKSGYVVGVTRRGIVVIFSKVTNAEYLDYVRGEVLPLIPR